jgi:hypothetical protein
VPFARAARFSAHPSESPHTLLVLMTTTINNSSGLDSLLRQSLEAIARTEVAKIEATANFVAVLSRIASNFRVIGPLDVHSVIEPAAAELRLNGQVVRAPRLLVQCTWRDVALTSPLTFVYTPTRADCIVLQITYGNVTHRAMDHIAWSAASGWHIPAHGFDIDGETHAKFLRATLHAIGLFTAQTLSLEPMAS